MAFEFKITATLAGDLMKFGPLIPGRVALPASQSTRDGVGGLFLLDTGAGHSAIDESVATELGLKPARVIHGHGLSGETEVNCYSVKLFIPAEPLRMALQPGQTAFNLTDTKTTA